MSSFVCCCFFVFFSFFFPIDKLNSLDAIFNLIGIGFGVAAFVLAAALLFFYCRKLKKDKALKGTVDYGSAQLLGHGECGSAQL